MENQYESSWQRASIDTRNAFHSIKFWLFEVITAAGLTIYAILWQPPWVNQGIPMVLYKILVPSAGVAAGLALIFLSNLITAPYRQRNETRALLSKMQKMYELQTTSPLLVEDIDFATGAAGPYWRLQVELSEDIEATECRGQLINAKCLTEPDVLVVIGPLQWSRGSEMNAVTSLTIRKGEPRFLDVVYLDPDLHKLRPEPWPIRIVYAGGDQHREVHSLRAGEYRFLISISAKARAPTYCICELDTNGYSDHFDFSLLYSGTDKDHAQSIFDRGDYQN